MLENQNTNSFLLQDSIKLQQSAINPDNSVWVFASAGSGKTKILTDRVLRLLLENTNPRKILCLTFTKVACNEMHQRIHDELSNWITLDDCKLKEKLKELLVKNINHDHILRARSLFIDLIEGKDQINIETIHSFSSMLLRFFPIEAKVPINFELIEEGKSKLLLDLAKSMLFEEAKNNSDLKNSIFSIFSEINEDSFSKIIDEFLNNKNKIYQLCNLIDIKKDFKKIIYKTLSLDENSDDNKLLLEFHQSVNWNDFNDFIIKLSNDNATNQKFADDIKRFFNEVNEENFNKFYNVFINKSGKKRDFKNFIKKNNLNITSDNLIDNIIKSINHYRNKISSYKIANQTYHLLVLIENIIDQYSILKKNSFYLDYDDIIFKTNQLVKNSDFRDWVKLKIDGNFNHILIDESQDTNIDQWNIIKALTDDFFSGESKINDKRSIFIVGDEKQSIYAFQGSDPNISQKIFNFFHHKIGENLKKIELNNSFRSTSNILNLVDKIFIDQKYSSSICKVSHYQEHKAVRNQNGLVNVWQNINHKDFSDETKRKISDYFQKISYQNYDYEDDQELTKENFDISNSLILSELIALNIKEWISCKRIINGKNRPVKLSDIMILVRKRDGVFNQHLTQSLNRHNIKYSSSGSLGFNDDLIIQDFLSIAKFVCLPCDDFNLVHLLKSPFFNFNEDQIFKLCNDRKQNNTNIFYCLKDNKIYQLLLEIIDNGKKLTPYNFYLNILGDEIIQQNFVFRFGSKSIQIIEKFLLKIIEIGYNSNLQELLDFIEKIDPNIKLDNSQEDSIKISTIHSSKGLQSPIIIIPDSNEDLNSNRNIDKILWLSNDYLDIPLYINGHQDDNFIINELIDQKKLLNYQENHRLLYVAITRAEDELYVMGHGSCKLNETWHNLIYNKSHDHEKINIDYLIKSFENYKNDNFKNDQIIESSSKITLEKLQSYNPTNLFNVNLNQTINNDLNYNQYQYQLRGELIHKILEFIGNNLQLEKNILANYSDKLINDNLFIDNVEKLETKKILANFINSNQFHELFNGKVKCETEIIFKNSLYRIDLLVEKDNQIIIVDYKSDHQVDDKNLNLYLKKLKIYQNALTEIYPNKIILTAILWIKNLKLEFFNS